MNTSSDFQFDDLQALVRYGHGKLTETYFLLVNIKDVDAAKQWLKTAPITTAEKTSKAPVKALQIALSVHGLLALGLKESIIEQFSDEFINGMSDDESRSRRLGDIGANSPTSWQWGGDSKHVPDAIVLLYAKKNGMAAWRKTVENGQFSKAFQLVTQLPTADLGDIEPFGFKDGISQPIIDWNHQQNTDKHRRDRYSNLLAVGEVVLGYPNEYGLYTARPLIDPDQDQLASELPNAKDESRLKDFGRNGSYLVVRQLAQDVPGFWQFLDKASGSDSKQREQLAAAMVGRQRDGTPLVSKATEPIPGTPITDPINHFTYNFDPKGNQCPIGAHVRRANPRTGDLPPRITGIITRIMKMLGFGSDQNEDLIASTRFHRILRRGRAYGQVLTPENAIKPNAPSTERGLQFMCLSGNILRQFEFVQNAWLISTQFSGLDLETDPLLGNRQSLRSGAPTNLFTQPGPTGTKRITCDLPQFVTVRGGGYFFMPGLSAIKYIAALPSNGSNQQ